MEKHKVILKYKNGEEKEMEIEKQSSRTLKIEIAPGTYEFNTRNFEKTGKTQIFYFEKESEGKSIYIEK